jgi:hypothetical protein
MITINKLKPSDYLHELDSFALDVSIAGIFACVSINLLKIKTLSWLWNLCIWVL